MRLDAEDLMEDSKLKVNKPKGHNNTIIIGIIIAIIIILIIILGIIIIINTIKPIEQTMKIYIDGQETKINNSIFLIENNKLYVSVKGIASYIGYEVHSGEYKIEAEDVNKVFMENKKETASMFLNSTTISKVKPNTNDEYKNYTMSESARNVNGDIYVISDGIEIAGNIKIEYNEESDSINIKTLPYIYESYNKAVQKIGFIGVSDDFENQKALLKDRIVIQNSDGRYGVIDLSGTEVIGTRYAYIQFNEYNKEFTITNLYEKVGIDYINGETKISVNYDKIESIHKDKGLYLVKSNNKYGVIDSDEKIILQIEYDDIGVDILPYTAQSNKKTVTTNNNTTVENIQKQYIFFDTLIAVKQNNMWGFFDLRENRTSSMKYTDIGCKVKKVDKDKNSNLTMEQTKTTENLLLIDEYELIIVEQNGKYGLIDKSTQELFRPAADDIYSITNGVEKSYYMLYNGKTYNLEKDIFSGLGLNKK